MFSNLTGWHFLIILVIILMPIIPVGIGIPATLVPHYNKVKRGEIEQDTTYNTLSIISLVLAVVIAVVGVVVAHVALSQIKRTHDRGWGLAVSALWIGYWNTLLGLVIVVMLLVSRSSGWS